MYYDRNWIFHSAITSAAQGNVFTVNRNDSITVEVYGTATASTVKFEGLAPSGTYYAIMGVNLTDLSMATETTTKGLWSFDTTGIIALRMNVTAVSGGNLSVVGKVVRTNG